MNYLEVILFVVAVVSVIGLGIWKSKAGDSGDGEEGASDYFLAGRGLTWWLVGFSLIAANISTEQFVGMSGQAADWLGMGIASYEWMAAVTLVIVAFWFLPRFLKAGLYTIPEFLEYRFDGVARMAMAIPAIVTLVFVTTSSVIFSGAKFVSEYYADVPVLNDLGVMCWAIGIFAAVYVFIGGLKACAWTDLIWGAALVVGGALVMYFAFDTLAERPAAELFETKVANSTATVQDLENANAWERFMLLNDGKNGEAVAVDGPNGSGGKIHMVRPKTDTDIPWTALLFGLWIPNFFYWGLNQYIVQRTLGSKSLAEGQKGIVFAAFLKLLIPFVVVIPGILAFNLFSGDLHESAIKRNEASIAQLQKDPNLTVQVNQAFAEKRLEDLKPFAERNAQLAGLELNWTQLSTPEAIGEFITKLKVNEGSEELTAENWENEPPAIVMGKLVNDLSAEAQRVGIEAQGENSAIKPATELVGYDYDSAFPVLVRELIKPMPMISWFVLAALCGAVISSLASMLNSASTIATMDIYAKFSGVTDQAKLVKIGRMFVVIFVIMASILAPFLNSLNSIFKYIQEFQGFISPGILAVFIFGFFSPRTPRWFGVVGITTNAVCYGAFKLFLGDVLVQNGLWFADEVAFLDRMAICFFIVVVLGIIITKLMPLKNPVVMPESTAIELESSKGAKLVGVVVVLMTIALYAVFW